jgi:aspartyl-tRNA(Asn)/glutamyl-tRNA(Gln) amidotransferase subunit B
MNTYDVVIGLEVHAQLNTQSKIFSASPTAYGADANTQASVIDLGLPGVLPVLNTAVVDKAIQFGLAVDARINQASVFARKNYFYPDLPKGYQISQFDQPIVIGGHLDIPLNDDTNKRIHLTRAHLEEDAGKSLHLNRQGMSGIDLNRAGTPLLEIVSEPDMCSASEAVTYLKKLHHLVRYLGICDGNMQEGSFRCDVNISLKPSGQEQLGTRAEIKNVNSFRFVEQAIEYEIQRQTELLNDEKRIVQETRQYNPDTGATHSLRSKEEAHDYRYFPDPDLLPVQITEEQIKTIQQTMPELPDVRRQRLQTEHQLSADDTRQIVQDRYTADFIEQIIQQTNNVAAKKVVNFVLIDIAALLNLHHMKLADAPLTSHHCAQLLARIADNTISNNGAKKVLQALWQQADDVDTIIEQQGLKQISDTGALAAIVAEVVQAHPQQAEQYRQGKSQLIGFFVGKVMQQTQGKANPRQVNELLVKTLNSATKD